MSKILLVEDEKEIRENIEILLESEDYNIITANDGVDALSKMEQYTPDLIISDIMMPLMDGFELYQKVKENYKTKMIPFIFLSAKSDSVSQRYGMSLGADDYLTKPFASEDLLRAIKIRLEKYNVINEKINEIRDSISKYVPHELRTPLVSIMGYSQVILTDRDVLEKNEIIEMVERISIGVKRLHSRIEKFIQLFDLEPAANGNWTEIDKICEISDVVIKEIILNHYYIKERNDLIEINIEKTKIKISIRYLKTIIKELLENSVKFSEGDKPVQIKGYKNENYYILVIKDSGIGMSENEIKRIGAFTQFNREYYHQEGNGLGLIFVKRVLQIINGELIIESIEHKCTTVTLKIPLTE